MFADRKAVATHLPLASSRASAQEEEKLLAALDEFALKFKPWSRLQATVCITAGPNAQERPQQMLAFYLNVSIKKSIYSRIIKYWKFPP